MVETLRARFLDRRTIDQAFPLVRNIVPGMTAARWARFVRPRLMPRSPDWPRGVMTVQNAGGCILSLFAFEVRADLHESRIFHMDHIMVPNLLGRGTIWGLYDRRRRAAGGDERLPRDSSRVRRRFGTLGQGHSDGAREYGVFFVGCPGFQKAGGKIRPRDR